MLGLSLNQKIEVVNILWIPFDYEVGPSKLPSLSVSQRYRIYLNNIKEAPKGKNYTLKDFT